MENEQPKKRLFSNTASGSEKLGPIPKIPWQILLSVILVLFFLSASIFKYSIVGDNLSLAADAILVYLIFRGLKNNRATLKQIPKSVILVLFMLLALFLIPIIFGFLNQR
jgi:ABC-type transport system involved in cytochrome c biogenesis permease subunit